MHGSDGEEIYSDGRGRVVVLMLFVKLHPFLTEILDTVAVS